MDELTTHVYFAGAAAKPPGPRIPLIITNEAYTRPGAKLDNTHSDGDIVKDALQKTGFAVTVVRDTKHIGELQAAVAAHADRLADAGPTAIGFLY